MKYLGRIFINLFKNNLKRIYLYLVYMELVLILEDADNKYHHIFNSTDSLEKFLETLDLSTYCYKNLIYLIDGDINYPMSKTLKQRYI